MTQRVILRCPSDPADLPSWLLRAVAAHGAREVALDLSDTSSWIKSAPDVVDLCGKAGLRVASAYGAKDLLGQDIRMLVHAQIVRPWCSVPEEETRVVDHRVRNGQVVQSDADVDVLHSIASGGEVVAGGSVRVVGRFGGRIVAGSRSADAIILCGELEPELVSISHRFVPGDKIDPSVIGRPCRIRLVEGRMHFEPVKMNVVEAGGVFA